ncbi:MAG: RNA 2',3'-cyclic phosphodiesterase [Balneolaceae bacterium]|nr:RNA 2',3'-cyclic phosphodiesterase [Balneolaceae bacterium]
MRLFIAIELPDALKNELRSLQDPAEGIRWQATGQLHITLKFLGDTTVDRVKDLKYRLNNLQSPSFSISVKGLGKFPKKGNPKVIWVGVSKSKKLFQLQEKVEKSCLKLGFEKGRRTFVPHITLGRVKKDGEVEAYRILRKPFAYPEKITVNHFTLFESRLSPEGAQHKALERYELGL